MSSGIEGSLHRNPASRDVRAFLNPAVAELKQPSATLLDPCNAYVRHLKAKEKRQALEILARALTGRAVRPKTAKPRRTPSLAE